MIFTPQEDRYRRLRAQVIRRTGLCLSGRTPADTRRNNNVFITSKRRRRRRFDVMKTLSLRHYCVMCPLGPSPSILLQDIILAGWHDVLD